MTESSLSFDELSRGVRARLLHWKLSGFLWPVLVPLRAALEDRLTAAGFPSLDKAEHLRIEADMPFAQSKLETTMTQRFRHPDSEEPFLVAITLTIPFDRVAWGRSMLQVIMVDKVSKPDRLSTVRIRGSVDAVVQRDERLGVFGKAGYNKRLQLSAPAAFDNVNDWQAHVQASLKNASGERMFILAEDAAAHLEQCACL